MNPNTPLEATDPSLNVDAFAVRASELFGEEVSPERARAAYDTAKQMLAVAHTHPYWLWGRVALSSGAPNIPLRITKTEAELDKEIEQLLSPPAR